MQLTFVGNLELKIVWEPLNHNLFHHIINTEMTTVYVLENLLGKCHCANVENQSN